jgi:hypothetical protein
VKQRNDKNQINANMQVVHNILNGGTEVKLNTSPVEELEYAA